MRRCAVTHRLVEPSGNVILRAKPSDFHCERPYWMEDGRLTGDALKRAPEHPREGESAC